MKKATKTSVTNKLDRECSRIVRSIGYCVRCHMVDYDKLQCAHIFSRTYKSVRWDFKNLLSLCAGCHRWAHNNPTRFTEFVKSYLGEVEYGLLDARARPTSHWKLHELEALLQSLKNMGDK